MRTPRIILFLIGSGDEIRLAPLYDLSSQVSYPELIAQRVAMKIGEHYDISRVGLSDWLHVARSCRVEEEGLVTRITTMANALPDLISAARDQALSDGLSERIIVPLARQLTKHAQDRLASITGGPATRRPRSKRLRGG